MQKYIIPSFLQLTRILGLFSAIITFDRYVHLNPACPHPELTRLNNVENIITKIEQEASYSSELIQQAFLNFFPEGTLLIKIACC